MKWFVMTTRHWVNAGLAILLSATTAGGVQFGAAQQSHRGDLEYDGRFTFVRLRWGSDLGFSRRGGFGSAWNHDYPRAERHLTLILEELTALDIHTDGSLILPLDDPELFKYPVAFMWEPGFWNLSDREAAAFRAYLLKGGFAVFEDFDGQDQWAHFEAQMRRVLPDGRFVRLDSRHYIFNTFFLVKDIDAIVHPMSGIRPSYYGMFEDNDPAKRLMVIANFDNDVPEYWEWSGEGLYPFDASNEAYKLGVNYIIYGLTH
ncbi:MAG TPA: DUF4159 domain-containing protein [Vicinamibacterales bacterium]|nr:DUF4159 domain-containing protein [Vicinamibacterales bacterium]